MNSKNTDKMEELLKEQAEIKQKILDNEIADPRWFKRLDQIQSLLWTNGESDKVRLGKGKRGQNNRVTSFTRDRR
jgi:hypothetical protein